jgi:hypothetical protein
MSHSFGIKPADVVKTSLNGMVNPDPPKITGAGNLAGSPGVRSLSPPERADLISLFGSPTAYAPTSGAPLTDPAATSRLTSAVAMLKKACADKPPLPPNGGEPGNPPAPGSGGEHVGSTSQALVKNNGNADSPNVDVSATTTEQGSLMIANLMAWLGAAQRKDAVDRVLGAINGQKLAALREAKTELDQAGDIRKGAFATLCFTVVSSAATIICASKGYKEGKTDKNLGELLKQLGDASSTGNNAVGALVRAQFDAGGKEDEAAGAVARADAKGLAGLEEQARAALREVDDLLQKVIAFSNDMRNAEIEKQRAIVRA